MGNLLDRASHNLKRLMLVVTAVATLVGGAVVTAAPASAAGGGTCNTNYGVIAWKYSNGTGTDSINVPGNSNNATPGKTLCYMAPGATGFRVEVLQRNLNRCYGENLVPDGIYGSATKSALWRAQSAAGITTDGLYGPQTRKNIKWRHHDTGNCFKDTRYL